MELGKNYLLSGRYCPSQPESGVGRGGGVLLGILGGGVPDPISDQKILFSIPVFRPDL